MKTLVLLTFAFYCGTLPQEKPIQSDDARLKLIHEAIAKTTPEGKEIIERVKRMLPEVNGKLSTLPLEQLVEKNAKEKNVTPIGWTAAIKRSRRWHILFFTTGTTQTNTRLRNGNIIQRKLLCIQSI